MRDPRFFVPGRYVLPPSEPITHFLVEEAPEDSVLRRDGVLIAWPNGERWDLTTTVHGITYDGTAPVWADDLANSHETRRKSTSQEAA